MNVNERSTIRAIRGPVTLITIGALFALNNFTPYRFDQTWPVILIVFGLLSLLGRGMERIQPPPAQPPFPGTGYAPPPPAYTPQGSYAQSPYAQAPTETAKGGFGTTAPPRAGEPTPGPSSGGNV